MKITPLKITWPIHAPMSFTDLVAAGRRTLPAKLAAMHASVIGRTSWRLDEPGRWPPESDGTYGVLVALVTVKLIEAGSAEARVWHEKTGVAMCPECAAAHHLTGIYAEAMLVA